MSLPTASNKPLQSSIRSFLRSEPPKYVPPPSQTIPRPSPPPPPPSGPSRTLEHGDTPASRLPLPPLAASLHPSAHIRPPQKEDIAPLKRINALLLPVSYPERFYAAALEGPFSRVITWAHSDSDSPQSRQPPKVVGGVVCSLDPENVPPGSKQPQTLYIRSLCLLSPYRGFGLAKAALDHIVAEALADETLNIKAVTAHVWTENEEGLTWYENRGFSRVDGQIQGYYLKLRPSTAFVVQKNVCGEGASVLSLLPTATTPAEAPGENRDVPLGATAAAVNLPSFPPAENGTVSVQGQGQGEGGHADGRPPMCTPGQSYQKQRPEMEWNDLPADMARGVKSAPRSGASSRSSSTAARKKRDRSYPAAAFGS